MNNKDIDMIYKEFCRVYDELLDLRIDLLKLQARQEEDINNDKEIYEAFEFTKLA